MSGCIGSHTKYQPRKGEWKCPKCGSDNWIIEEPSDLSGSDCELLHEDDELVCLDCSHGRSGKTFAAKLQKAANMVTCPHCNGSGLVISEVAK